MLIENPHKFYKEEDIFSLQIKGLNKYDMEKQSVLKLKKMLYGQQNLNTTANEGQLYAKNFNWMKNHAMNEDLEGEDDS